PLRPLRLPRPRAAGECPFLRRVPIGQGWRALAHALRGALMRDLLALYEEVVRALDARELARAAAARAPRPAPGGRLIVLGLGKVAAELYEGARGEGAAMLVGPPDGPSPAGGGVLRGRHAMPIGGVRAVSSGPAIADETTCADALALAHKYGLPPAATRVRETLKPGEPGDFIEHEALCDLRSAAEEAAHRAPLRMLDSPVRGTVETFADALSRERGFSERSACSFRSVTPARMPETYSCFAVEVWFADEPWPARGAAAGRRSRLRRPIGIERRMELAAVEPGGPLRRHRRRREPPDRPWRQLLRIRCRASPRLQLQSRAGHLPLRQRGWRQALGPHVPERPDRRLRAVPPAGQAGGDGLRTRGDR